MKTLNLKNCEVCGKGLTDKRLEARFCSRVCYGVFKASLPKNRIKKKCLNCNKEMELKLCEVSQRKFCSLSCSASFNQKDGSWNKGIEHTKEEKEKIGLGVKRHIKSLGHKYVNPSTKPEVKSKISKTITELFKDPTKNPNWKGGISFEVYPKEFNDELRSLIKKQYNNKCAKCKTTELLLVHHKDRDTRNNKQSNLICLCKSCHMKEHYKDRVVVNGRFAS